MDGNISIFVLGNKATANVPLNIFVSFYSKVARTAEHKV